MAVQMEKMHVCVIIEKMYVCVKDDVERFMEHI